MSFNLNRTLGPLQEMWRTMGFEQVIWRKTSLMIK